jgi:hypothetical protein
MMLLVSGKHRPMYDNYNVAHLACPRSRTYTWTRAQAALAGEKGRASQRRKRERAA